MRSSELSSVLKYVISFLMHYFKKKENLETDTKVHLSSEFTDFSKVFSIFFMLYVIIYTSTIH